LEASGVGQHGGDQEERGRAEGELRATRSRRWLRESCSAGGLERV
jgi:hypothetical protein